MGTVTTQTNQQSTAYTNQRKMDRTQNGVLWMLPNQQNNVGGINPSYSTDNGNTWVGGGGLFTASGTSYTAEHSIFIDLDDYIHVVYKNISNGTLNYARGVPNAARTSYSWTAGYQIASLYNSTGDIVAHRLGTGWAVHIVFTGINSSANYATYSRLNVDSAGNITTVVDQATIGGSYNTGQNLNISLDFNHTGDGKTVAGSTPHLYVAWTAGTRGSGYGIRFRKAVFASNNWSWNSEREIDPDHWPQMGQTFQCLFDGTRVIIGAFASNNAGSSDLMLYDRDPTDPATGGTTARNLLPAGSGDTWLAQVMPSGSITYDASGNVYFFGSDRAGTVQDDNRKLFSRRWTRSSASLDAIKVFDTTGRSLAYISAMRGTMNNGVFYVYTDGADAPVSIVSGALNAGPNTAPIVVTTAPKRLAVTNGAALSWIVTDPDVGDSVASTRVRYREAGATTWINQTAVASSANRYSLTGLVAGKTYEWSVNVTDAAGASTESATASFVALGSVMTSANVASTATQHGNQRKIDRTQNGNLWTVFQGASNVAGIYVRLSTDGGTSWVDPSSGFAFTGTGTSFDPNSSFFIDIDDYAHIVYKDRNDGRIYYRRGTPDTNRTVYSWSSPVTITTVTNYDHPDLWAHREGSGWAVHIIYGYVGNDTAKANYTRLSVNSSQAISVAVGTTMVGNSTNSSTQNGFPSIDGNHTGDGKTVSSSAPHLYVGFSGGNTGAGNGLRFVKATYSGGNWSWGSVKDVDTTHYYVNSQTASFFFDGTRCVFAGCLFNGGTFDIVIHDRDAADPASGGNTLRTILSAVGSTSAEPNGALSGSATYDSSGNIYYFGRAEGANGTRALRSRRWNRSSQTLDASVIFESAGLDSPFVAARRGSQGYAIDYVYTTGTASPFSVLPGKITINQPPLAPTLTSPVNNSSVAREASITFTVTQNDPDGSSDGISVAEFRYRLAGTTKWISGTPTISGNTFTVTFAASTLAGVVEWQARTTDAAGLLGVWSASSFVTLTAPTTGTLYNGRSLKPWTVLGLSQAKQLEARVIAKGG